MSAPAETSLSRLLRALHAGLRLCHFDRSGLAQIDADVAGFWRSYLAALVCLPLHLGVVRLIAQPDDDAPLMLVNYTLTFVIQWLAWPLAAEALTRRFGCAEGFLRYATAYNWMNAPQIALFSAVVLATLSGAAPAGIGQLMVLACFIYVLVVKGWLAREALGCATGRAATLVIADVAVNLAVALVAELVTAL